MKIALLNGSPKVSNSASGMLLEELKSYFSEKSEAAEIEIVEAGLHKPVVSEEICEKLKTVEAVVFAYPLYVDGIPAHLLSVLTQLEKAHWNNQEVHSYGIVNCGFYEGIQAEPALEILENWCARTGLIWGGGLGIGGGGALSQIPDTRNGKGPRGPINNVLRELADSVLQRESQENNYASVAFPRFLYKMAAQMGWRQTIKANGGKKKDLGSRPGDNE